MEAPNKLVNLQKGSKYCYLENTSRKKVKTISCQLEQILTVQNIDHSRAEHKFCDQKIFLE